MTSRTSRRFALAAAALILIATIPLLSQGRDDRPDEVASNRWIRLGDSAGIVITGRPSQVGGKPSGNARGELWIKLDGKWVSATLEQAHQLSPAH